MGNERVERGRKGEGRKREGREENGTPRGWFTPQFRNPEKYQLQN